MRILLAEDEEDLKEEQDEIELETPVEPEKEEVVEEIKIDKQLPIFEVQTSPQEEVKVEISEPEQPAMEQMMRSEPENYTGKMYIETPRMIIRDFTPEDAADLHEIFGDDETMENCELAYDFDKTEKFLISFCIERKGA